ncbi:MAG: hypothetical protein HKL82_09175 [Acidimicrobiaceae bacterium]|nr:hypothetical protein [Acidimicrobiaceae bacterium]
MKETSHCDFSVQIAPYVQDDLPESEVSHFEAHLNECNHCSRELADFRLLIALIGTEDSVGLDDLTTGQETMGLEAATVTHGTSADDEALGPNQTMPTGQASTRWRPLSTKSPILRVAAVIILLAVGYLAGTTGATPTSVHYKLFQDASYVGPGTVTTSKVPGGTELSFNLSDLPQVGQIGAWVKTTGGRQSVICWWPLTHGQSSGNFMTVVPSTTVMFSVGIQTKGGTRLYWHQL